MGANRGTYSRNMYSEGKHYLRGLVQEGIPWIDADDNDSRESMVNQIRRTQQIWGNGAIADAFQVQAAASPANNFKLVGNGGDFNLGKVLFVKGFGCALSNDTDYVDDGNTLDEQSIHPRVVNAVNGGVNQIIITDTANIYNAAIVGRDITPNIERRYEVFRITAYNPATGEITVDPLPTYNNPSIISPTDDVIIDTVNLAGITDPNMFVGRKVELDVSGIGVGPFHERIVTYFNPATQTLTVASNFPVTPTAAMGYRFLPYYADFDDELITKYYRILLSTPGGLRQDGVYLNVWTDEVDTSEDPTLYHQLGTAVEAQLREQLRQEIYVAEDAADRGTWDGYVSAGYTDLDGRAHYVYKLADLYRTATANITAGMIIDQRTVFSPSGTIDLSKIIDLKVESQQTHAGIPNDNTVYVNAGVYQKMNGTGYQTWAGGNSAVFASVAANPRYDLVCLDDAGALAYVNGAEGGGIPEYPTDKLVIAVIYIDEVGATPVVINDSDITDVRSLFVADQNARRIRDRLVDNAAPAVGQAYVWDGAKWIPGNVGGWIPLAPGNLNTLLAGAVAGNKYVLLPGTFTVAGATVTLPDDVTLLGSGVGTTIINCNAALDILTLGNRCRVSDIEFTGTANRSLQINGVDGCIIENCKHPNTGEVMRITNANDMIVRNIKTSQRQISITNVSDMVLEEILGNGDLSLSTATTRLKVARCDFEDLLATGAMVQTRFEDCKFETFIVSASMTECVIDGLVVYGSTFYSIDSIRVKMALTDIENSSVRNLSFVDCNSASATPRHVGLYFRGNAINSNFSTSFIGESGNFALSSDSDINAIFFRGLAKIQNCSFDVDIGERGIQTNGATEYLYCVYNDDGTLIVNNTINVRCVSGIADGALNSAYVAGAVYFQGVNTIQSNNTIITKFSSHTASVARCVVCTIFTSTIVLNSKVRMEINISDGSTCIVATTGIAQVISASRSDISVQIVRDDTDYTGYAINCGGTFNLIANSFYSSIHDCVLDGNGGGFLITATDDAILIDDGTSCINNVRLRYALECTGVDKLAIGIRTVEGTVVCCTFGTDVAIQGNSVNNHDVVGILILIGLNYANITGNVIRGINNLGAGANYAIDNNSGNTNHIVSSNITPPGGINAGVGVTTSGNLQV